jgi:phosphomannomutase
MLPSLFKSYDIRGLAPQEIDASFAHRLGETLANTYKPKHVLIGHDMRTTSPELEASLIDGFTSQGIHVTRIGLCSTPMFYFAVGEGAGRFDLGVMVTASHNPAKYNGFKMVKGDVQPIGQGSGMEEIRDAACGSNSYPPSEKRGDVQTDTDVKKRYLDRVFQLADLPANLPTWSVAIDAGNGMNGHTMPDFAKRLPSLNILPLYWDLDGSFPNHEANPLNTDTLKDLQKSVRENACAFGIAFDGDGDRVGFVDEEGTPIPGDMLTALFAQELLREKKSGRVLYDLRSSWSTAEAIRKNGGDPGMCRVGHAHIKRQMRAEHAIFAGELSMHFYFADMWYAEASDYAALLLLKILAREEKPLSKLWRPLQTYAHSGEINFHVKDQATILKTLDETYTKTASEKSLLDGLRFEFCDQSQPEHDWWFNVRASNTEPVLRLNLEARTREEMEKRREELKKIIEA